MQRLVERKTKPPKPGLVNGQLNVITSWSPQHLQHLIIAKPRNHRRSVMAWFRLDPGHGHGHEL